MRVVRVVLLGCGTVGGSLVRLVRSHRELIRHRWGVEFLFSRILVRDLRKPRHGVPPELLTNCPEEALAASSEVVVELIGGIQPSLGLIWRALEMGRPVVTANKALLAHHG
ncbi:MAG: homoserine dehydrogenase, partial [Candidatus Caldarchaeum sp.]